MKRLDAPSICKCNVNVKVSVNVHVKLGLLSTLYLHICVFL